ncbi:MULTISPECIES: hypothetical protein [unclassified Endozoicomonas]|uniref:hypothetical protein n=1 Tax=unclassified Endozoicomonas TaxID=2644528 RepID=UPI0021481EB9|nr:MULTISPECIES: hypothetical protein [unclassified Endozoicomonas]
MEKADKKVANLVVLAAGSAAAEAVGEWHNKVSQQSLPDDLEIKICTLTDRIDVLQLELSSLLAKADLIFVACGVDAGALSSLLLQQSKKSGLTPVVLLSRDAALTLGDLGLLQDKVSVIRSDTTLAIMIDKLLEPLVSEPFVRVDVDEFKSIVTPGSEGFLAVTVSSGDDASFDTTEQALIVCRNAMAEKQGSANIMVRLTGKEATFSFGDYIRAGEAVDAFSSDTSKVLVSTSCSKELSEGSYEAVVTFMKA